MLKGKGFLRGVNLGGWLSQCDYSPERMDSFVKEADFQRVADWGLDHVRLPVDVDVVQTPEGELIEAGLRRVDRAFTWAERNGLGVVLDLHKANGYAFSPDRQRAFFTEPACREQFFALWECFAQRYGSKRTMFDLLNEVTDREYLAPWREIAGECVRRIRRVSPETPVLLGSYHWNGVRELAELGPRPDELTVYNFHCYEPLFFTHQRAPWSDAITDKERQVSFAESGASPAFFEDLFAPALEKAKAEGAELYCGEYGVIDQAPTEEALPWYRAIHQVFQAHGIGRCAWNYREMDFGIGDARWDGLRAKLLEAL